MTVRPKVAATLTEQELPYFDVDAFKKFVHTEALKLERHSRNGSPEAPISNGRASGLHLACSYLEDFLVRQTPRTTAAGQDPRTKTP